MLLKKFEKDMPLFILKAKNTEFQGLQLVNVEEREMSPVQSTEEQVINEDDTREQELEITKV
jgi:hypothetical protein